VLSSAQGRVTIPHASGAKNTSVCEIEFGSPQLSEGTTVVGDSVGSDTGSSEQTNGLKGLTGVGTSGVENCRSKLSLAEFIGVDGTCSIDGSIVIFIDCPGGVLSTMCGASGESVAQDRVRIPTSYAASARIVETAEPQVSRGVVAESTCARGPEVPISCVPPVEACVGERGKTPSLKRRSISQVGDKDVRVVVGPSLSQCDLVGAKVSAKPSPELKSNDLPFLPDSADVFSKQSARKSHVERPPIFTHQLYTCNAAKM